MLNNLTLGQAALQLINDRHMRQWRTIHTAAVAAACTGGKAHLGQLPLYSTCHGTVQQPHFTSNHLVHYSQPCRCTQAHTCRPQRRLSAATLPRLAAAPQPTYSTSAPYTQHSHMQQHQHSRGHASGRTRKRHQAALCTPRMPPPQRRSPFASSCRLDTAAKASGARCRLPHQSCTTANATPGPLQGSATLHSCCLTPAQQGTARILTHCGQQASAILAHQKQTRSTGTGIKRSALFSQTSMH